MAKKKSTTKTTKTPAKPTKATTSVSAIEKKLLAKGMSPKAAHAFAVQAAKRSAAKKKP